MSIEPGFSSDPLNDFASAIQALAFELKHIQHTERGAVLAMGALLDTKLRACIVAWTPHALNVHKDAFGERGLLAGMTDKIQFLFLHGAYSEIVCNQLTIVARIRNRFAHDYEIKSFDHPKVNGQAKKLIILNTQISVVNPGQPIRTTNIMEMLASAGEHPQSLREVYLATITVLVGLITILTDDPPPVARHRLSV